MPSFIIRGIDAALMERVKARAEAEGVTVKAAIINLLEQYGSAQSFHVLMKCTMCGRRAYALVGERDQMTQPNGEPCGGRFLPNYVEPYGQKTPV